MEQEEAGATIGTSADDQVMDMACAANLLKAATTAHGRLMISESRAPYVCYANASAMIFIRATQEVLADSKEWADLMSMLELDNGKINYPILCMFHWALCEDLKALQQQQQCTIFCNDVASKLRSMQHLRLDMETGRLANIHSNAHMVLIRYGIEAGPRESISAHLRARDAEAWRHHFAEAVQNCKEKALAFCMGAHGRLGEASPLKKLAPEMVRAIFDAWWTEDCTELVRLLQ